MAFVVADRVKVNTTTTGTGTIVLNSTAATGYQSFAVIGDGNTTYYTIAEQSGTDWEVGIGTYYLANSSLARTTILASSNANAAVTFGTGAKDVFVTYPAEKAVYANNTPSTANYILTATGAGTPPTWQPNPALPSTGNTSIAVFNTNITSNVTISAGTNGLAVGPVTLANNNTITITDGQKIVVL